MSTHRQIGAPAIDGTLHHMDQEKLASAWHWYHSALLIGKREAAARAGHVSVHGGRAR